MVRTLRRLSQARTGLPELVSFKSLEHPLYLRPGTPDAKTVITNIIRADHGRVRPPVYPTSMIDAGAYIGDSSSYFLSKYPRLKVVALEPDPDNYEIAKQNLTPYGNRVCLLNQALAGRAGTVCFSGQYEAACISNRGLEIEATTVPAIMRAMSWERVSIVKIDIEGEELTVVDERADIWLQHVDLLIVENHSEHTEAKVRETLRRNGFSIKHFRTSWFCMKHTHSWDPF